MLLAVEIFSGLEINVSHPSPTLRLKVHVRHDNNNNEVIIIIIQEIYKRPTLWLKALNNTD